MTDKEFVLEVLKEFGRQRAEQIQMQSSNMTEDELYISENFIPSFQAARSNKNMLKRKAGSLDGFVCKSSAGRIVRLIQNYDSSIHTQEPEELLAYWKFLWPTDPWKALPFIAVSTSPYNTNQCCTYPIDIHAEIPEIHVWASEQDNNVWAPGTSDVRWKDLGKVLLDATEHVAEFITDEVDK